MKLLFSNHIYEYVVALATSGIEMYVPDNAQRKKVIDLPNVHVVPLQVVHNVEDAAKYLLQNKIDVVYAQGRSSMLFFYNVRRRLKGLWTFKIIVTIHSGYVWCFWWKSLAALVLARCHSDGLIFLANAFYLKYGWFASLIGLRSWVVRNPVDLSRFPALRNYDKRNKMSFHVGYVGVITPMKGQSVLIDAIQLLHKKGLKVRLTLVGDVDDECYYKRLTNQITKAGLEEYVVIQGRMPYDGVPAFMAALDCYVCPSLIEVLPFNILEAMASGLPIVATRVGGVSDLVQNDKNGWLCRKNNADELSECIARVCGSANIERLGQQSQEWAETIFSNNCYRSEMMRIFNSFKTSMLSDKTRYAGCMAE